MKASLLAVAVLATLAVSSAVDEDCIQRKLRGLPVHWPNPSSCESFFRCTNKNVKRELLCPAGKQYNPLTGRCASNSRNLCKLSFRAPLAGTTNPCADELSGVFVAQANSCRNFNICNNNLAYPQSCDKGSYFNADIAACEPDTQNECWENFCIGKSNGVFLANENDCHSFYVCSTDNTVAQQCPAGSYFDRENSICQPGACPYVDTTTAIASTATAEDCPSDQTTTTTTESCPVDVTTSTTTVADCSVDVTTLITTTEDCSVDETTTPTTTTEDCSVDDTTTTTTEDCTVDETTTTTTEDCTVEETTTTTTEDCSVDDTTPTTTTEDCTVDETTTTTTEDCTVEETTTTTTEDCSVDDTTPTTTTEDCTVEETTTTTTEDCTVEETTTTTTVDCSVDDTTPTTTTEDCTVEETTTTTTEDCSVDDATTTTTAEDCTVEETTTTTTEDCTVEETTTTTTEDCTVEETTTPCPVDTTIATTISNDCPEDSICKGQENGAYLPNENDCDSFFVCLDDKPIAQQCPENSYFDSELLICKPGICPSLQTTTEDCSQDTTTPIPSPDDCPLANEKCDASKCISASDNTLIPAITGNEGYCVCLAEKPTYRECLPGTIYDATMGFCVSAKSSFLQCAEYETFNPVSGLCESLLCEGKYEEGDFVPNSENAMYFYICFNGKLEEYSCEPGNYYNDQIKACLKDEQAAEKNLRKKRSAVKAVCPGGYFDGDFVEHPSQCNKFYICDSGKLQLQDCGAGNRYDAALSSCVADTKGICSKQLTTMSQKSMTCPGGYAPGTFLPHPLECDKFYICENGRLELQECGMGSAYNANTQSCVADIGNKCWPNYCLGEANYNLVANPKKCDSFYMCLNQQPIPHQCDPGEYFNSEVAVCEKDLNAICYNPCCNVSLIAALPHPECTKFYLCNDHAVSVESCTVGAFDPTKGACDCKATCPVNECEGKPNYYTYAVPNDTTQFYICINNVPTLEQCLPGTQFTGAVCTPVGSCDCDQEPCQNPTSYVSPFATKNPKETNAFCSCLKGVAIKEYCNTNSIFNEDVGVCVSNEVCPVQRCENAEEYTKFVPKNSTTSFCMCVSGVPVLVDCPNEGTFNPYTMRCSTVEISNNCNQDMCQTAVENIPFPTLDNSNGFCLCKDDIATYVPCGPNSVYDEAAGVCKLNNINCDSSQCGDFESGVKFPAITTNQGYCECNCTTATYVPCQDNQEFDELSQACVEPICDPSKCPANSDINIYPTSDGDLSGFCLCNNGDLQHIECPVGYTFNVVNLVCEAPLPVCDNIMCIGVPDYTALPARGTDTGFCFCSGGEATFENCEPGYVFTENLVCENQNLCNTTVCGCSNNGQTYSAYDLFGYCKCTGEGEAEYIPCPEGEIYDLATGECSATGKANCCDLQMCSGAALSNPLTFPSPNGDTSFCYCSSPNDVMEIDCPAGKYYNDNLKVCTSVITESCSCPNGMTNGERAPMVDECDKYYECANGVMHEQQCAAGEFFDSSCNQCKLDTNNVCASVSPCSCYGVYHQGERIAHPLHAQYYYECKGSLLHELNCGNGYIFNDVLGQCVKASRAHLNQRVIRKKRSVATAAEHHDGEFLCINDEKRSVPSNCSQYEICLNNKWKRRTCSNYRYYNPEQKKCLEPRDDMVCEYAKVTSLPICNAETEQQTIMGKVCTQYYKCQNGKWRLKLCGRKQYYDEKLATCISTMLEPFECGQVMKSRELQQPENCQALTVRPYNENCAMYLMCLASDWWYQYCPLGMYFNRSLNYCMPDLNNECRHTAKPEGFVKLDDFSEQNCSQEGLLRPSAYACNRYFICINNIWQVQHCSAEQYFNATSSKCIVDIQNYCQELNSDCLANEKRSLPLNCSAYEECTDDGKWLRKNCMEGDIFDPYLSKCIANDDSCSANGLRKVCKLGDFRRVQLNCSEFYYCQNDSWLTATCLKGQMFDANSHTCTPHSLHDECLPLAMKLLDVEASKDSCQGKPDGTSIAHEGDCTKFHICIADAFSQEMQCSKGSFFDAELGYCKPNDGSCRLPLTGPCENATDGALVADATDCQKYFVCSTINGTTQMQCPVGQYYHMYTKQCRVDHGECKPNTGHDDAQLCKGREHGIRLPHDTYCNLYYACVRGLAIPVECPENYQFNAIVGKCLFDELNECEDGQLVNGNFTYSCGSIPDGSYLADRKDCTRYYICISGQAESQKCGKDTFFDSEQLLCVPDDGTCPYVNKDDDDDEPNTNPVAPDPIVCEGKHGYIMPDPLNCNNFYVCVNGKLRHERCYENFFFNITSYQCQAIAEEKPAESFVREIEISKTAGQQQCLDKPWNETQFCSELTLDATLPQQGDCRRYVTCPGSEDEAITQTCRNGESYDSLLGFCRQNDGTCLLENGQRLGECSGKHGQLTRDAENCRRYFVCINGQKIAKMCEDDEYFSKTQNMCLKDVLQTCEPQQQQDEKIQVSCLGLSETVLYPYVTDQCRSYFQCIKGKPKLHQCADNLYFDPIAIKCVDHKTDCIMPTYETQQRSPELNSLSEQLCAVKGFDYPVANIANKCRSFYVCHAIGNVTHELCPLGMLFSNNSGVCMPEDKVKCI